MCTPSRGNGDAFEQTAAPITNPDDKDSPGWAGTRRPSTRPNEQKSGDLIVVASNACCSCIGAAVRPANSTAFDGPSNDACAHWTFMRLVPQRGGDALALVGDWGSAVIWSGSVCLPRDHGVGWAHAAGEIAWADAAWVGSQPVAIAVQRGWPQENPEGGVGNIHWLRSTTGATWQKPAPVGVAGMADVTRVQLEAFPRRTACSPRSRDGAKSLWIGLTTRSGWAVSKAPVVSKQLATSNTRVFSIAIKAVTRCAGRIAWCAVPECPLEAVAWALIPRAPSRSC